MKDAFGAELKVGNGVVYAQQVSRSAIKLYRGKVIEVSKSGKSIEMETDNSEQTKIGGWPNIFRVTSPSRLYKFEDEVNW